MPLCGEDENLNNEQDRFIHEPEQGYKINGTDHVVWNAVFPLDHLANYSIWGIGLFWLGV